MANLAVICSVLVSLTSFLVFGFAAGVLLWLSTIYMNSANKKDPALLSILIIVALACIAIMIAMIAFAVMKKKWPKYLNIIFGIVALGVGIGSAALIIFLKGTVLSWIGNIWTESKFNGFKEYFENDIGKCCGFNVKEDRCVSKSEVTCRSEADNFIKKIGIPVFVVYAIISIVCFIFVVIGAIKHYPPRVSAFDLNEEEDQLDEEDDTTVERASAITKGKSGRDPKSAKSKRGEYSESESETVSEKKPAPKKKPTPKKAPAKKTLVKEKTESSDYEYEDENDERPKKAAAKKAPPKKATAKKSLAKKKQISDNEFSDDQLQKKATKRKPALATKKYEPISDSESNGDYSYDSAPKPTKSPAKKTPAKKAPAKKKVLAKRNVVESDYSDESEPPPKRQAKKPKKAPAPKRAKKAPKKTYSDDYSD